MMMMTTNNPSYNYASPMTMNDSGSTYTHYDDTCMTDMSMTSAWSSGSYIPTPFTNNNKSTKTATSSRRKSSGNLLSRSKSMLFNPSTWSSSKQADHLDDESTYCHLSDDGIEVLAGETQPEKSGGKRLKRSGSLSNMLKTPSRLALRKSTSKLKLVANDTPGTGPDTPASAASLASYVNRELPPLPPLPAMKAVPAASSATPSSAKSTKSLFARAVLRDKTNKLSSAAKSGDPDQALPGIVATQVQRFQTMHGSQPAAAPLASVGKTPKQNWLGRLHIGRSSGKKKVRLEIPFFEAVDSPSFQQSVDAELENRKEQATVETLREPSSIRDADSITPTIESPPAIERLSLAVGASSVLASQPFTQGRLSPYESTRPSSNSYFPTQAVVTSSPFSGDLHLGRSPAKSPAHLAIKASIADDTAKFSIFSEDEKRKISTRPQSDPMPLKNVAGATEALRTLLDDFEDTFRYERDSTHTSAAPTMHTGFTGSVVSSALHEATSRSGSSSEGSDVSDDLQDLIDGVMTLSSTLSNETGSDFAEKEQRTNTLSIASSFEGSASTAQEAIIFSSLQQQQQQPSFSQVYEPFVRTSLDDGTERPSLDTERPFFDGEEEGTQRPSFDNSSGRPSFDSGRSSFDYGEEEFRSALANVTAMEPERSYYRGLHRRNVSSAGAASARSSLRDYLAMERPGLGERMLEEVDEDVDLDPVVSAPGTGPRTSYLSTAANTTASNRSSLSVPRFQTARTSRSSFASASSTGESFGGISFVGSPTPADKLRGDGAQTSSSGGLLINRHSMDVNVGSSTRVSLDVESTGRPSIDLEQRPSFDSNRPLPASKFMTTTIAQGRYGPLVKLSTASSLFSLSSVNSSPCPRPAAGFAGGKKKLLMLTGNRLPRGPMISAPVFRRQHQETGQAVIAQQAGSPVQGRVKELKTTWEERLSPKKDDSASSTGSSPRYVRPLPSNLGSKLEIARPQRLSSLSLTGGAIIPPDTPPPSSPSASEMSFSSGARSSVEADRRAFHSRLSSFGRKSASSSYHHRRQSSQLSRSSILNEPIPEETARYGIYSSEEGVDFTMFTGTASTIIKEEESSPEAPRPLVIRKKPSLASASGSSRLSMGLDAFQLKQAKSQPVQHQTVAATRPFQPNVMIKTADDDQRDWEEIENSRQMIWNRFCSEAVHELQKSRALWPDTEASVEVLESPMSSFPSISLNSGFLLTPGSPLLTSPAHTTAIVSILLDSRARYRSHAPVYEPHDLANGRGSPDVPNTPELSPDSSLEVVRYDSRRGSEVTPPSPTPQSRLASSSNQSKRPSYQPRSLVLVEKHLSAVKPTTNVLAVKDGNKVACAAEPVQAVAVVKKSTKGWKPRAPPAVSGYHRQEEKARSPVKKPTSLRPILTPGRKVRSITSSNSTNANKRALTVYSDEIISALSSSSASASASETGGRRTLTNSFLVGRTLSTRRRDAFAAARRKLEGIGAPEEQNSGGSSGTSENDDTTAVFNKGNKCESGTLEARGSVEAVENAHAGLSTSRPRPRPAARRTVSGIPKTMRV